MITIPSTENAITIHSFEQVIDVPNPDALSSRMTVEQFFRDAINTCFSEQAGRHPRFMIGEAGFKLSAEMSDALNGMYEQRVMLVMASFNSLKKRLKNTYVVVGRAEGSDEDDVSIYTETPGGRGAMDAHADYLCSNSDDTYCSNDCVSLMDALDHARPAGPIVSTENEATTPESTEFSEWLDTFIKEKGIDPSTTIEVEGQSGTNDLPLEILFIAVKSASEFDQEQIKEAMTRIDFQNGDLFTFFRHIARAIAL